MLRYISNSNMTIDILNFKRIMHFFSSDNIFMDLEAVKPRHTTAIFLNLWDAIFF
jgi:hypothetical protein